jgi:multiple sugar transport system permease protein
MAAATRSGFSFRGRARDRQLNILSYLCLLVAVVVWLAPFAWAIDTAFKPESQTTTLPISWFPTHWTWDAFTSVLSAGSLPRWFFNSVLTSTVITVTTVLLSSLAAFSLSRIPFRGRTFIFVLILAGIMVPTEALIVPLFTEINGFGMINTYWAIILPQVASPIAVFIFKQFFDGVPHELEEAAFIDGASRFRIYWQIWMPLSRPAIAAVSIFTFISSWNNFLWPLIAITGTDMMTIPVGLATVQSSYGVRYAQIMATSVLAALPLLLLFIFFQRQIVQGIASTGIKG